MHAVNNILVYCQQNIQSNLDVKKVRNNFTIVDP